MDNTYWNTWYSGGGWFLWIGIWFLMISSFGNWGYTYRVHRRYGERSEKNSTELLNERYARGDINREEFHKIKNEMAENTLSPA